MNVCKKITAICSCLFMITGALHAQYITKQEKGYFNITNIVEPQYLQSLDTTNSAYGRAYTKQFGISFSTINGFFINPNFSVGLGVGLQLTRYKAYTGADPEITEGVPDKYFDEKHNLSLLPIFADFRYYPSNFRNNMMLILDVGYAPLLKIDIRNDKSYLDGGPLLRLGAGYKVEMSDVISFLPSLNFQAQRLGDNTVLGGTVGIGFMF